MLTKSRGALLFSITLSCCISSWWNSCLAQSSNNVVTTVHGKVSVKRTQRSSFVPVYVAMSVNVGDTFRLESANASATITCSDGSPINVDRSPFKLQCPKPTKRSEVRLPPVHNRIRVSRVRGSPPNDVFPVLISPRMTSLLSRFPVIRWSPARGSMAYRVSLLEGSTEIWSISVGNVTAAQYPQDPENALLPGKSYLVVISTIAEAGNVAHSSTEEQIPNLGFSVLPPKEAQKVRAAEAKLRDLNLPDGITRFLVAELYANWTVQDRNHGKALTAEAIELLESVEANEPAAVRLLADLYQMLGLASNAELLYMRALKLSQDTGDIEGQALAHQALGIIFAEARFNKHEAIKQFNSAKALSQMMGDAGLVREIESEIKDLETP